jgi:hypothetical protein
VLAFAAAFAACFAAALTFPLPPLPFACPCAAPFACAFGGIHYETSNGIYTQKIKVRLMHDFGLSHLYLHECH